MKRARSQFLAGTCLTLNQDGGINRRNPLDHLQRLTKGTRVTDEVQPSIYVGIALFLLPAVSRSPHDRTLPHLVNAHANLSVQAMLAYDERAQCEANHIHVGVIGANMIWARDAKSSVGFSDRSSMLE